VRDNRPSWPGGGTVAFVSPWRHDYLDDLAAREEAGTPNVIGDIRAALAFIVKDAAGAAAISENEARFDRMAREAWCGNPHLLLLGADKPHRLPIFSFLVRDSAGCEVPPQLFTRLLSDIYGVQARGGCACAGPYGHRLLNIDRRRSEAILRGLENGQELLKPGWTRLNFSYLMSADTVSYIIGAVDDLSRETGKWAARYRFDSGSGQFLPTASAA